MKAIIDKYASRPFDYDSDCCKFVADCIEHLFGFNPNFQYSTEDEADRIIDDHGGLAGAITAALGEPHFGYVDGCVALVRGRRDVAGVFYRGRIICRTQTGVVDLPPHRAVKVWNPCRN